MLSETSCHEIVGSEAALVRPSSFGLVPLSVLQKNANDLSSTLPKVRFSPT